MKRILVCPIRTTSENKKRALTMGAQLAIAKQTKAERATTELMLRQFPAVLPPMPGGAPIAVTLVRISAGCLDDDNLRGALKAVRDGVADWMGIDDRDKRVTWAYQQQGCPLRQGGTRIEVDDEHPGPDVQRILGDVPSRLTAPSERGRATAVPPAPPRPAQVSLLVRPVFARLPWDPPGVLTRLPVEGEPPKVIRMRAPARSPLDPRYPPGSVVVLHRNAFTHPGVGAVWLFAESEKGTGR